MAQVSSFVNTARARVTAYLKAMEDIVALQSESTALGGLAFINAFDFQGEIPAGGGPASQYDMTEQEFSAFLTALGEVITAFNNGSLTANANRKRDLYRAKVS